MGRLVGGINGNLKDQLVFYGSYHNNPINQLIHFVFVPTILWTVSVWLAYTPSLGHGSSSEDCVMLQWAIPNASLGLIAAYSVYYMVLDLFAGVTWTIVVGIPIWISSEAFRANVTDAWVWALGLHVFAWFMQIYPGHALAEGRKPALIDSFVQSLLLAPLFVWFELLFLLGYKKQFRSEVQTEIDRDIAQARGEVHTQSKDPLLSSSDT